MRGIFLVNEEILTSLEGLCCTKLVV